MTSDEKGETLTGLNQTLTSVENELLRRKVDRDSETLDDMVNQVNKLADDDIVSISYGQEAEDDSADEPAETDDNASDDSDSDSEEDSTDSDD